jgi:regulator of replication initiation timing
MAEEKYEESEFELIPLSPLRKLEKRLDEIEQQYKSTNSREFYKELIDIIRLNQQIVDELAKANDALRIELSRLPGRLDDMISRLNELISFIKASATEELEVASPNLQPLVDKINELVELNKKVVETNQTVAASLDELLKRLKKPIPPPIPPAVKKAPLFPRPV